MNYYEAREIKRADGTGSGKWHFTKENDGQIWPVGYCAEGCEGHNTPDEAAGHYHEYLLDRRLHLRLEDVNTQRRCRVCDQWTTLYADLDHTQHFVLCDEHQTREVVAELSSPSHRIVSSW